MRCRLPAVVVLLSLLRASSGAAEAGIAAEYPGDVRIGRDPRVVLVEDFENGEVSDLSGRWSDVKNPEGMSFVADVPAASPGRRALEITSQGGANNGGHLYTALQAGQERLYFRYYVQYAPGGTYHHSGGWLGGYNPKTGWPGGGAGERPRGDDRFTVGFEPVDSKLRLDFYAYWLGMRADGGGGYWGNHLLEDPTLRVQPDRWTCVEVLLKLNEPVDRANGELAVWVDGVRTAPPASDFQWRGDPALDLNFVWLQHYTTDDPPGHVGRLRFDHVVVATDYVGPIAVR